MYARPLLNKRVVVTRAEDQARELVARLRTLGAEPLLCPAIAFAPPDDLAPLDNAIARLAEYDWLILTSVNGVRALFDRVVALGVDPSPLMRKNIGAIGPATAEALAPHNLTATFVPSAYVAESILAEIGDVAGQRILLPRADIARPALVDGLRERGAVVDEIVAYRTVPGDGAAELVDLLRQQAVDAVTFTSSSTVRYLLDGLEAAGLPRPDAVPLLNQALVACIGPITAGTARDEGLRVDVEAREYTTKGLVAALVAWYDQPTADH